MSDAVHAHLRAALADRYELLRELGAGGMATVYLARDVKHAREVAIKVLHPELAAVLGAERFLSEIRTTASLQHPHILPLFDSGEAGGQLFYVMPYVDGETLRGRLERETQLPIADAVLIAREVADALQYAHDRGVIHRDIKPENILLQGGHALVADFGIALAVTNAGGTRMTQTGLSLGTPQYMAPEQAMGERTIDARADIYALGAVTYEMLAGEPPFTGPTSQAIVAKVMSTDPQRLDVLRRNVPSHVADAVHEALEKLPADRFATARQFAESLGNATIVRRSASAPGKPAGTSRLAPSRWRQALALSGGGLALVALGTQLPMAREGQAGDARTRIGDGPLIRAPITLADDEQLNTSGLRNLAVSASGDVIAYVVTAPNGNRLYVRDRTEAAPRRLDVEGIAGQVAFSPDGQSLAYAYGAEIRRVPLRGGRSERVALAPEQTSLTLRGLLWLPGDTLVMAVEKRGLWQVLPGSSRAEPVDTSAAARSLRFPVAVGDGQRLLTMRTDSLENRAVAVYDRRARRVIPVPVLVGTVVGLVGDRLVLVSKAGTLQVVPLDTVAWQPRATPSVLLEDPVVVSGTIGIMAAVSPTGTLAVVHGRSDRELILARPGGDSLLYPEARAFSTPRLSPDGRRIVLNVRSEEAWTLWLFDGPTRTLSPLKGADGRQAEWSTDGQQLRFLRDFDNDRKPTRIWSVRADNSTPPTLVDSTPESADEVLVTRDERLILYRTTTTAPHPADLLVRPAAPGSAVQVLESGADVIRNVRLSPDGRWLALQSNRSGRDEVYVRPFPGPGPTVALSADAARDPMWSPDGQWVYYATNSAIVRRRWFGDGRPPGAAEIVVRREYVSEPRYSNYDVLPGDGGIITVRRAGGPPRGIITFNVQRLWESDR